MKNYTLKIYKTDGTREIFRTKKKKRFLKILRTKSWQLEDIKRAYLKVSYGKKVCIRSCLCEFYNDGYYETKTELLEVFKFFDEED